ncbi:MAG: hypothetical protein H6604_02400 [Flavobacteriales bacterium]|nr:hypothetical protein [Flavobacteriales bacterium]
MKKKILFYIFLICTILTSCITSNNEVSGRYMTDNGEKNLIGYQSIKNFKNSDFEWYEDEYSSYKTNPDLIKKLKKKLLIHNIVIFTATWDSNAKKQFPRVMKILDEAKFPHSKIKIYTVDKNLESFYGEELKFGIEQIPTFIVRRFNTEIGRITNPTDSNLENSLYNILNQ